MTNTCVVITKAPCRDARLRRHAYRLQLLRSDNLDLGPVFVQLCHLRARVQHLPVLLVTGARVLLECMTDMVIGIPH